MSTTDFEYYFFELIWDYINPLNESQSYNQEAFTLNWTVIRRLLLGYLFDSRYSMRLTSLIKACQLVKFYCNRSTFCYIKCAINVIISKFESESNCIHWENKDGEISQKFAVNALLVVIFCILVDKVSIWNRRKMEGLLFWKETLFNIQMTNVIFLN